jgi:t-SNARE complex subunit (syntaxin)
MRQVKTSLEVARNQRSKTTNSLSKTSEEIERLESLMDPRLGQVMKKEIKRFATQQASIDKSRQRVLKSREKLAMTLNRNRALTELRQKLQYTIWEEPVPAVPKAEKAPAKPSSRQVEKEFNHVELKY